MEKNCKHHGLHSDWRYQENKREYLCRPCIRERKAKERKARNEVSITRQFGESCVAEYSEFLESNGGSPSSHINAFRSKKRFENYPPYLFAGSKIRYRNIILRIERLNAILKLDYGNIGWNCSICGEYDKHQSFFDIDHILAKCNGGDDSIENYQVLCPNCHKRKTLEVDRNVITIES